MSNAEDDDDFLKRLKWPKLSDKQVDAVLGRLDGGKESEKNGNDTRNFLKIIEIPGDFDRESKNVSGVFFLSFGCTVLEFDFFL